MKDTLSEVTMYSTKGWLESRKNEGQMVDPETAETHLLMFAIEDILAEDVFLTGRQFTHVVASVKGYGEKLSSIPEDDRKSIRFTMVREIVNYLHGLAMLKKIGL